MAAKKRVPKPSQSPLHIPRTRSVASPPQSQIASTKPDGKGGVGKGGVENLFPEHLFPPSKRDAERRHCIPLNSDGSVLDPTMSPARREGSAAPQSAARRDVDKPWVLADLDENVGPAMLPVPITSPARREVPADPPPPDLFREKLEACTKAIAELASFLLSSTRPNRFSEASRVALLARQLAFSTASRAKDLPLGNGAGLMAYPMVGGGGVVEGPIFAEEAHEPLVGARAMGGWAGVLGDNFQNPNDAGINQRDALLSLMTSMQAQGDQARANTRRALAGELEDLLRVRDQLATRLDVAVINVEKDHTGFITPEAAQKVATLRQRLETLDKRIARLFAQIEADPVEPAPAPAPAPAAAPAVAPLRVPPRAPAPFRPAGDFR